MFKFCISFHKILKLLVFFLFQLLLLCLHEVLFHLHDSCALCIHTILRSYWMSWDPHLSCWILENSQIAWILELALLPHFFMWSIQHLIMCHQSSLVFLLLTRKFNKIFCKFQERKDLPGFQNYIFWSSFKKPFLCPIMECLLSCPCSCLDANFYLTFVCFLSGFENFEYFCTDLDISNSFIL